MKKRTKKTNTPSHIGADGKPQHYIGTWLDTEDYLNLELAAIGNHRSIAGEIRNRILGTTTMPVFEGPKGDTGESSFKK